MLGTLKAAWKQNRRVLSNFFSLSVLQFANYLAPLITLPYLVRVLGPSRYGLVEFARALSIYFVILTEYGFSLSATREISIHRDDPRRVSEIFSAVMVVRLLLLGLSFIVMGLLVWAVPKLRAEWLVYLFAFGTVVGQTLFPVWLFQGLERMKHIAILNIVARLLITVSIFVFIRRSAHYVYVPLVQSAGIIFMGAGGLIMALRGLSVRFEVPSAAALWRETVNGWHLFLSRMATTLYTTSNAVILGLFTTDAYVGYYAAGDKIVRAIQGLQLPLSQAIFPHIGRLASESKTVALTFTRQVAKLASIVTLMLSIGLLIGAPLLGRIILGAGFDESVPVIRILSFLPFIIGLSNVFGVQIMVNFGMKRTMTLILVMAGLFNLILAVVLVVPLRHVGVSVAALLTETFITIAMLVTLRRSGLGLFRDKAAVRTSTAGEGAP